MPSLRLRHLAAALALTGSLAAAPIAFAADEPAAATPRPERALKALNIVMIENDLRVPGLATPEQRDEKLAGYGYFELGRMIRERAPAVLAANGLHGAVVVIPQPPSRDMPDLSVVGNNDATLVLNVAGGREQKVGFAQHRAYLSLNNVLFDKPADDGKRTPLWGATSSFRLGSDEALGVLLTHRVDAKLVDTLLTDALTAMAGKGFVELPQGKAVRPAVN